MVPIVVKNHSGNGRTVESSLRSLRHLVGRLSTSHDQENRVNATRHLHGVRGYQDRSRIDQDPIEVRCNRCDELLQTLACQQFQGIIAAPARRDKRQL